MLYLVDTAGKAPRTVSTYSDADVVAGTTYRYRVRGKYAAGNFSPYSNVADATTGAGTGSAAPTITGVANQTIIVNGTTGPLNFTIGDADTTLGSLTLSKGTSNPTLVPTNNIVFGGSGSNRTVTVTPSPGQSGTTTITVSVSDGALSTSNSFVVTVNAAASSAAVRVNAGGGTFTDSAGNLWSADTGFNTGTANSVSTPINNTVNDALYQTERWDASASPELTYGFNLPNGDYLVNLHFAEIYSGAFGVGKRVFDGTHRGTVPY